MKTILKLEELAQFVLGIALFGSLDYQWWWFPALLLTPDIGMLGYVLNSKAGAVVYNIFHHKGIAIGLMLVGYYVSIPILALVGVIMFSHSAMDRIFGYGLKFPDSFKHTHLGTLAKK